MQNLTTLILLTTVLLSCFSCDLPKKEDDEPMSNTTTNIETESNEDFDNYFNTAINTVDLYAEDLMRTIQATVSESPNKSPLQDLAEEVEEILNTASNATKSLREQLAQSTVNQIMIDNKEADKLLTTLQNANYNLEIALNNTIKNHQGLIDIEQQPLALPLLNPNLWASNDQPTQFQGLSKQEAQRKLFKIQQNISQSKVLFYRMLCQQMNKKTLVYDKFDIIAKAKKDYILLGETYKTEIALGTYSTQAKFSVSVNGQALPIKDGKATYKARPGKVGEQKYKARISVSNPLTGETETVSKDFFYEVGSPYVSVSPDNMNIFFIGEDNPVTITATGIPSNNLILSISGGGATIKQLGKGKYTVKVVKTGKVTITIKDAQNGRSFPFEFEAKEK